MLSDDNPRRCPSCGVDPDANWARCELLDSYEEALRDVGVSTSGNPAGQTHYDMGQERMRLALAPLIALRAYLDCRTPDREDEYHAMDPADQERVTRFGSDCVQAGLDACGDAHSEAERLSALALLRARAEVRR